MDNHIKEDLVYRDGYRYPFQMIRSSLVYPGVFKSMEKPHGFQHEMKFIIDELLKGKKYHNALFKKGSKSFSAHRLQEALALLLAEGIITIIYENKKPQKGRLWIEKIIELDLRAQEELTATHKDSRNPKKDLEALESEIKSILRGIKHPFSSTLQDFVHNEKIAGPTEDFSVTPKAWITFRSIILALAYLLYNYEKNVDEPLRIISQRVWGKSKILERFKHELTKLAHQYIDSSIKLNLTPEQIYFHGDISFTFHGHPLSGLAGFPVIITEETAKGLKPVEAKISTILVIENLAPFLKLLQKRYVDSPDILLLYSEGYMSTLKKQFLNKVLEMTQVPVHVWSDLDAEGLQIALDIIRHVQRQGWVAKPVLMTANELALSSGKYQGCNRLLLEDDELSHWFADVIDFVKDGKNMEQEELLLYYEAIRDRLP
ncbi:DUF2399 domain-containing protein [Heliobacillus mobilis]|uniref:DUF2399 domain-containing protein n=1 Tax=Heliobacterium mobile TaxID=28064 RepID=A0A6I3SNH3_HELMO|nr:Wadjet anti-phage system protein JetD domain-containing protein [Heliobacterium mobile]MTV50538.1 DUF2399 domain-containing protein [Heliobacterium mobile]